MIHYFIQIVKFEAGILNKKGATGRNFKTIHIDMTYDLELDGMRAPEENVQRLIEAWEKR